MSIINITPAGAFVNSIDAAAAKSHQYKQPSQPIEKPRKPVVRNIVTRLIAIFIA